VYWQLKALRDASPKRTTTDVRISGDLASNAIERPSPSPSSALGAASYGALTMGITVQPSASLPQLGAHSDDDSMGESAPSRSPSPAKEALTGASQPAVALQMPSNAFAAASALPVQQSAVSPRRVSILRGGPVAGSYIDGRWAKLCNALFCLVLVPSCPIVISMYCPIDWHRN